MTKPADAAHSITAVDVLCVDDDEIVLRSLTSLLKNNNFKIYFKDIPFPTPEWNKK